MFRGCLSSLRSPRSIGYIRRDVAVNKPLQQSPRWALNGAVRWASKASKATARSAEPEKFVYSERLLVYHAGTVRTAFIGLSKIATFIVAGVAWFYVAPIVYEDADDFESYIWIPGIIIGGIIPVLWTSRATKPFAVYIHVILPKTARRSRQALLGYLNGAKQDITLDMTTLNFFGFGRPTRMRLGELMSRKETFGNISNLVHQSAASGKGPSVRSVVRGTPTSFHVGTGVNHAKEPKLWNALLERVRKENPKATK